MFYEMIAGFPPYQAEEISEIIKKIIDTKK